MTFDEMSWKPDIHVVHFKITWFKFLNTNYMYEQNAYFVFQTFNKLTLDTFLKHFFNIIYTASKVKHHLNIFLEKTVKLSKYEFILVTCSERDKVVTIYSNFLFDYH